MIKIERTETYGWEAAIRGMRNPMNSWAQSDSRPGIDGNPIWIGARDGVLMKELAAAGSDHGKYLRMITVTADITAPLYWWKEYDTYKVGTVANSCSTMHKIHSKAFTLDDFSHDHLWRESLDVMEKIIAALNICRDGYNNTDGDDNHRKEWWWQMIQLLPSSYNQKRTVQLNYAVLKNIYHAREGHKLDEWKVFCGWINRLPHSVLITDTH